MPQPAIHSAIQRTHPQTTSLFRACLLVGFAFTLLSACSTTHITNTAPTVTATTTYPLFEMRTYTTNEGKLDALHTRFRDHTRALFEKHGMQNVAYWTPTDKPNTLVYVLAHQSKEAAAASWKAFVEDPAWRSVYAASIADGRLVANIDSVFMTATDYSPAL